MGVVSPERLSHIAVEERVVHQGVASTLSYGNSRHSGGVAVEAEDAAAEFKLRRAVCGSGGQHIGMLGLIALGGVGELILVAVIDGGSFVSLVAIYVLERDTVYRDGDDPLLIVAFILLRGRDARSIRAHIVPVVCVDYAKQRGHLIHSDTGTSGHFPRGGIALRAIQVLYIFAPTAEDGERLHTQVAVGNTGSILIQGQCGSSVE